MTRRDREEHVVEPERYELAAPPRYTFDLGRRDFVRVLTALGGGLLVVARALPGETAQESGLGGAGKAPSELGSWLHIGADGRVTGFTGKVEIGQNIRTSLAQAIGDELRVPLASIVLTMADTDLTPFDQGTFGSRTTPTMAPVLARAAATAREQLMRRAAERWGVSRDRVSAADGAVSGPGERRITYAELVAAGDVQGVVLSDIAIAPKASWTLRGRAVPKVNAEAMVTGAHAYVPDLVRPGCLHGRVVRPPAYGATLASVEAAAAKQIPGVDVIVDGDFVGVTAPSERLLRRGVAAVRPVWRTAPEQPTSRTIYDHLRATASGERRPEPAGDVAAAKAAAALTLTERYLIPYIAHVPLEPRAAVAEWTDGRLTVWTGTQRPFGVRGELARAFRLPEERVRVIVPDMGSGYGGKHTGEQAIEAARLARAAGRPVKLVYTRAEEFMWGYFRPAGVIEVTAAVDGQGRLSAWEFDNINSGGSGIETPYRVAAQRVSFHPAESPLRQGSYRGLAATANHYAREMHMDALARALRVDPVDFRRRHLDNPRLRAVLDAVDSHEAVKRARADRRPVGIACGTEKGSVVAGAAIVSRSGEGFTVERFVVAFECGAIVNPDGLHHQVEGAVVQGLGGALFEAVAFAGGRIENGSLARYRVPRFRDVPPIEVLLLDRPDLPSAGAGETPIVCVAPAIGSAVRALGPVAPELPVRLRS